MKRSGRLRRTGGLVRSGRLPGASRRRSNERDARARVKATVLADHGYRCVLAGRGDCRAAGGRVWRAGDTLDVHEVVRRSQLPGAHLDERLCVPLCRGHHDLDVRLPVAEQAGIRAPRWTIDRYGVERVVAELARVRAGWCTGIPVVPFWREQDE